MRRNSEFDLRKYLDQNYNIRAIKRSPFKIDEMIEFTWAGYHESIYFYSDEKTLYWYSDTIHPRMFPDMHSLFFDFNNLEDISGLSDFDVSGVKNLSYLFVNCKSLQNLEGLETWDISNVENLSYMCSGCKQLKDISALRDWNLKNTHNICNMFTKCVELRNIEGLRNWDVTHISNMNALFNGDYNLNDLEPIRNWDPGTNTLMYEVFYNYKKGTLPWYREK